MTDCAPANPTRFFPARTLFSPDVFDAKFVCTIPTSLSAATSAPTPPKPARCWRCSATRIWTNSLTPPSRKKIRLGKKLNLPAARSEFEALAELRRIAGENKVFRSFIGQGYYDTHHAAGHPAQRPGKSRLVYAIHAVSGRNFPRPARSAAEFSDDGHRPHRARHRQRLDARRGHRRRRSHDHVAAGLSADGREYFLRLGKLPSANHRSRPQRAPRR